MEEAADMFIGNVEIRTNVFLAPMAGITDKVFRMLCREQGCGMAYTEMVSAKGLFYGSEKTEELLETSPGEHPVGAQIFGSDPEIMAKMAERVSRLDVDLIDINMGCPTPKIVNNGDGSALMRDPKLAGEIIRRTVKASCKPVTVKIRKGWDSASINAVEIALIAQEAGAAAVTVHGRTREQFYSGEADWDIIGEVKSRLSIPVIGNGDVFTAEDAAELMRRTGCDGVMIGRGALGNPWIFRDAVTYLQKGMIEPPPGPADKINMALRHLKLLCEYKGEKVAVREMRKHIAWYLKGLKDSGKVKTVINKALSQTEIRSVLQAYLNELEG